MSYCTIQINAAGIPVADMSAKLLDGDSTKGREILTQLRNLLDAIEGGQAPSSISVSSSTIAGTVSGQTGGTAAFTINLT
jgi:hypothetical protein